MEGTVMDCPQEESQRVAVLWVWVSRGETIKVWMVEMRNAVVAFSGYVNRMFAGRWWTWVVVRRRDAFIYKD